MTPVLLGSINITQNRPKTKHVAASRSVGSFALVVCRELLQTNIAARVRMDNEHVQEGKEKKD
jgi:hypothetical protein